MTTFAVTITGMQYAEYRVEAETPEQAAEAAYAGHLVAYPSDVVSWVSVLDPDDLLGVDMPICEWHPSD